MSTDITIRHVPSPEFRTFLADNCIVSALSDNVGDRVIVTLTRMEGRSVSELARQNDSGSIEILGGITPTTEFTRVLETAAEMRPDHALALSNAIRLALSRIPEARRAQYGIPSDINQIQMPQNPVR